MSGADAAAGYCCKRKRKVDQHVTILFFTGAVIKVFYGNVINMSRLFDDRLCF